jgi:hypothetical protein
VFDLSKHKPDVVLRRLWSNLEAAIQAGDSAAKTYRERLRILVAGGDGTIAWWVQYGATPDGCTVGARHVSPFWL